MSNLKKKILNKLHENNKADMQTTFDNKMKDAKDVVTKTLGSDTPPEEVEDIASQLAVGKVSENDDSTGRGIGAGMNPEVEADKYEEYRALMAQLAAEEGGEQPVKEEGTLTEGTSDYDLTNGGNIDNMMRDVISILGKYVGTHSTNNGAVANDNRIIMYDLINSGKFKGKVQQMLSPQDMHKGSSGREVLTNNEGEMVRFLKSLGVNTDDLTFRAMPVTESTNPKMTKNKLVEAVTGRKVIKTIKVKDIK